MYARTGHLRMTTAREILEQLNNFVKKNLMIEEENGNGNGNAVDSGLIVIEEPTNT